MIEGLAACFAGLTDPRETSRCDHRLVDILAIAVCAVVACAESWEDIALYGRSKQAWLGTFLALPNGIPSHDTFRRVFMLIDPDAFEACFTRWAQSLADGDTDRSTANAMARAAIRETAIRCVLDFIGVRGFKKWRRVRSYGLIQSGPAWPLANRTFFVMPLGVRCTFA